MEASGISPPVRVDSTCQAHQRPHSKSIRSIRSDLASRLAGAYPIQPVTLPISSGIRSPQEGRHWRHRSRVARLLQTVFGLTNQRAFGLPPNSTYPPHSRPIGAAVGCGHAPSRTQPRPAIQLSRGRCVRPKTLVNPRADLRKRLVKRANEYRAALDCLLRDERVAGIIGTATRHFPHCAYLCSRATAP